MAGTFTGVQGTAEARFAKLVVSQAAPSVQPAAGAPLPTPPTRAATARPPGVAQQVDNCWVGIGLGANVVVQVYGAQQDAAPVCYGIADRLAPPPNPRAGQWDVNCQCFIEQNMWPVTIQGVANLGTLYTAACSLSGSNTHLVVYEKLLSDGEVYTPNHALAVGVCRTLRA